MPDYARLDIIYENGGIYLDTDVELVKNLDDLLENHAYIGFEDHKFINPGLGFGAEKNNPMIKNIMDSIYGSRHFIKEDGSFDLTPSPQMNTSYLVSKGLLITDQMQNINGMTIYPTEPNATNERIMALNRGFAAKNIRIDFILGSTFSSPLKTSSIVMEE